MNYTLKFFDFSLTNFLAIAKAHGLVDSCKEVRKRAARDSWKTKRLKNKLKI